MEASTGEEFDPSYLRLIRDRLEGNVPGAAELAALPSCILRDDWDDLFDCVSVSLLENDELEFLLVSLAFGERWEQVTSPETALRTPGLEKLVELKKWGYA